MGLQAKSNSSFLKRLSNRLRTALKPSKKVAKELEGPNSGKVIEVYDVLIKTSHKRLQFFHLVTG